MPRTLNLVDGGDLGRLEPCSYCSFAGLPPGSGRDIPSERVSAETRTPRQADPLAPYGFSPPDVFRRSLQICGTGFRADIHRSRRGPASSKKRTQAGTATFFEVLHLGRVDLPRPVPWSMKTVMLMM